MIGKLVVVLMVCCLFVVPVVSGLEVVVNQYDYGAYSSTTSYSVQAVHPSSTTSDSAWGQSFRSRFDDCNLTVLQVVMWQSGATGGCTAYLIGETGTFGSSSLPTGSVLATSNEVTVTAGTAGTVYNFTFASGYLLDSAVDYCWYVAGTSGDVLTTYVAADNSAPISVDPSVGNAFYWDSSAWTAVSGVDLCFTLYGSDGSAVSFNLGGDVTINEITEVTNTTAVINGTISAGDVSAGAVTAGDITGTINAGNVTASGGVSVDVGGVTAEFTGTVVNSSGVVNSTGEVTISDLSAEMTNGTFTVSSGGFGSDYLVVWIVFVVLAFVGLLLRVPIVGAVLGSMSIMVGAVSLGWDLPAHPYLSVLLVLMGVFNFLAMAIRLKDT